MWRKRIPGKAGHRVKPVGTAVFIGVVMIAAVVETAASELLLTLANYIGAMVDVSEIASPPHTIRHNLVSAALAAVTVLTGCASTRIDTSGSPLKAPLCHVGGEALTTAVYWLPQWRPDQKEPLLREAAALRGIQDFLSRTSCLSVAGIHRLPTPSAVPSGEELVRLVATSTGVPERVVLIIVRELGPRIAIGIPGIVEGGTEVLIDVQVLNPRNSATLAHSQTFWRNGGTFVIKGVKTLDQDMSAALRAALMPSAVAP